MGPEREQRQMVVRHEGRERDEELREVRARGWAVTDEPLAPGIRSVAAPLRDGGGRVVAALNVTVRACCCVWPGR